MHTKTIDREEATPNALGYGAFGMMVREYEADPPSIPGAEYRDIMRRPGQREIPWHSHPDGYMAARCPLHDGCSADLILWRPEPSSDVLVRCQLGCDAHEVLSYLLSRPVPTPPRNPVSPKFLPAIDSDADREIPPTPPPPLEPKGPPSARSGRSARRGWC